MKKCLVVINHTFRINSRIFRHVLNHYDNITVIYASPWYYDTCEREVINKGNQELFKETLNYFAAELLQKLSIPLYILKSDSPGNIIEKIKRDNEVDTVYYDMPLFGNHSWIKFKSKPIVIESDSYDPRCGKMTAKSRWTYWSKNRHNNIIQAPKIKHCESLELNMPVFTPDFKKHAEIKSDIDNTFARLQNIIPDYHKTRNHKDGSTQLSKYLHHGVIDAAEIVSGLLDITPSFLEKDHPVVPLLRQLAFREMCIRKARVNNLTLSTPTKVWAETLIDKKSYESLLIEKDPQFSPEQFLTGKTGNELLDREIKRLVEDKWLPNRVRMWISSQCYYGLGGGIKSLETLINLFDMYSDDGQSPNNYVCCVEAMRLQYGKVMNYNTERTFKLINGK